MKFSTIFKYKRTKIWFIVSSVLLVLLVTFSIVASTALYDVASWKFGGGRQAGRGEGRYFDIDATSKEDAYERGNSLNEKICEEGFVLLKNKDKALPLAADEKKVSIFGKNSVNLVYGGSGSGGGKYDGAATIYDSLAAAGYDCNPTLKAFYEDNSKSGEGRPANPAIENSGARLSSGETKPSHYGREVTDSYADYSDVAIVVFSRIGGEGFDLPYTVEGDTGHYLELDTSEKALLDSVTSGGFGKVIVLINSSNIIEASVIENNDKVDACMFIGGPGYRGINALGRLIKGDVSPSGRTVDTWATDFTENPVWGNFANNLTENGATYYTGTGMDKKLTQYYFVDYEENIYVGYRYYETRGGEDESWYNEQVVYPFGYGLSYTNFDWEISDPSELSSLTVDETNKKEEIEITVKVTNTGDRAGKDVVQLYCDAPINSDPEKRLEKPSTVLVGFAKTPTLYPLAESGEGKPNFAEVTIKFDPYYAATYDDSDANDNDFSGYELEGGKYELKLKTNAHEVKTGIESIEFTVPEAGVKYDLDPVTGEKVENLFDDADEELDTVLSRYDWENTWPTSPNGHNLDDYSFGMAELQSVATNNPKTDWETYKTDEPVTVKLIELRGKAYDDPKWKTLLDSLSFDEMKNLFNKAAYKTVGIDSVVLPATLASDGPVGWTNFAGEAEIYGATSYASETVVASAWNTELIEKMGESIGEEAAFGNEKVDPYIPYTGWYAPGINIHRSPFGGRNFEYFSEDPLLTGKLAAAEIRGAQSKGLVTYMKHFALNEQETHRDDNGVATWATEQSIREIYLRPFEIAVKEGKSRGLMTSFNRIGTKWTGGDYRLMTEILRDEWGFVGAIICDFNVAVYMHSKQMAYAGGDLNLTTTRPWSKASAENAGDVAMLRRAAHNAMYVIVNSNAMNGIDENTVFKTLMPMWQLVLIVIDAVLFAGLLVWGVVAVISVHKKEKTKNRN